MAGIEQPTAVILSDQDDVATLFSDVVEGKDIRLRLSLSGKTVDRITARQPIPFGHKVALRDKAPGDIVCKYGHPIGQVVDDIQAGDHVHTHNMVNLVSGTQLKSETAPILWQSARLKETVSALAQAADATRKAAENFADALTEAHLRGVETHGIRRLKPYLERVGMGSVDPKADPVIEQQGGILMVDGRNGIGHHVAATAADAASEAAKKQGVGIAIIRNSNHFGFAGYFATRIAKKGQIGMVISNGQICVGPPGGKRSVFSNNPIAVAAPAGKDEYFELDMATSVTSRAKIVQAAERGDTIPLGLALDGEGRETEDPHAALDGSLLPFGGEKGFAFLFALEVLTGVLPGGAFADQVFSKEANPEAPEGLSQFIMAIDLEHGIGIDAFKNRFQELVCIIESVPVQDEHAAPRFPGKRRWHLRKKRLKEGIPLSPLEHQDLVKLAAEYGIDIEP